MLTFCNRDILDLQVINLTDFLQEGDVLVFNDARVIKAKLSAQILRNSAQLDFNLDQENQGVWNALCKPAKKVQVGDELKIAPDFFAEVLKKNDDGTIGIKFDCAGDELLKKFEQHGSIPLPPYIKRAPKETPLPPLSGGLNPNSIKAPLIRGVGGFLETDSDSINYQTIYAARGTAVAAPTAGLHFNEKIFAALDAKKIYKTFVTLNVGAGTFLPVRSDLLKDHKMHSESFSISQESAEIINAAKARGKKIVAVGTTSLRVLESSCDENGVIWPTATSTQIFIYPPYKFKIVDVLMTNFHLPKSTLFMLICAFVGKEKAFEIYNHAISRGYRFYSYGDTSLLFKS